jgi:hypothetical protein
MQDKCYYDQDCNLHRIDGPAIERANGDKYWYLDGKKIYCKTNEKFLKMMKYKWLL